MALATCLVAVWVKAFDDITVARATCGVSPPASGTRLVNPGLTVWPKVILEALADVAVGGTELSGTHGLMLTWVQITHISTVVTIVTWDQTDGRGSIPTLPCTFFKPAFAQLLPLLSYSFVVQETRLREVT